MSNINTKFLLRIDSWTNWNNATEENKGANLVLLKGEIGLCEFASGQKDANGVPVKPAAVLFKVGDGASKFSELKWASALAADVHDWAKQSENDFVNTFLNLKMNDGTTMRTKLDGVFATDAELASAIAALRLEIPTQLGVMSVKATGDAEITMTPTTAASGDVTITAAHAAHAAGTANTASTDKVEGYSATGTIKIPKITTNAAGHVTAINEETVTITMPAAQTLPTVNDGTLTLKASKGVTATQRTFSANDADNVTFEVNHGAKPTSGTPHAPTAGSGRTYVTQVDVDSYGHIAKVHTATETDQDLSNYKTKQTAVISPVALGSTLAFIDDINQNENGEITATKKNVDLSNYALKSEIPDITITDDDQVEVPTADTVNVYKNLTASGHTLTEELVTVPTKAYVDKMAAGAVDYLGTLTALTGLSTTARKGDFYRVSTELKSGNTILAYAGDLVIAEKDKPTQSIDETNWTAIHCGDGDISEVIAGTGMTGGGSTGSVTLNHQAKPTSGTKAGASNGSGRTYVTEVLIDTLGHVSGVKTATESVADTWRPVKVNGTQLLAGTTNTKQLDLVAGTNVTLTPDATNGKVTINASNISISINEKTTNNETLNVLSHQITSNGHNLNVNYYEVATKAGLDTVKGRLDDLEAIELDASGVTNDGVVTESLTGSAIEDGKLKLTGSIEHAKKGPTSGFTGTAAAATADAWSESVSIKVPKIKVDAYGHTTEASEITYKVQLPANPVLALDYADTAVAKQFVTEVDQTDGKISVKRGPVSAYDLAEAGKTPVTQQDYLVFYGGTSTDVI